MEEIIVSFDCTESIAVIAGNGSFFDIQIIPLQISSVNLSIHSSERIKN